MKNLRLMWMLLKMRLSHMMVFRLSFFGAFFVDGTGFLMQILMFEAIYGQVESIGDWGRAEMIIFLGTFSLLNAINMVVYFFGVNGLPGKIKDGALDHYVTKPMNPLLRLSLERVDLGSVPLVIGSIGIILYGASHMIAPITPLGVIGYIFLVLLMGLLYYDVEVILRTIPFFVISFSGVERIEGELLVMCMKVPGVFFKGAFKLLFYVVLPYGVMATLPTQFFTGSLSPGGFMYAVLITAVFTVFALGFFRFGLRRYKSASS